MNNIKKIIQKIKSAELFRVFAEKSDKIEIKPDFYWKILIFILIFGLMSELAFNLYLFRHLNKIDAVGTVVTEKSGSVKQKFQKEKLDEVLKEFEKRKNNLSELTREKPTIPEP